MISTIKVKNLKFYNVEDKNSKLRIVFKVMYVAESIMPKKAKNNASIRSVNIVYLSMKGKKNNLVPK